MTTFSPSINQEKPVSEGITQGVMPAGAALPKVTVAIINFNGAQKLPATLRSVFAQEGVELASVMVLDNASSDDSLAVLESGFPTVAVHGLPQNRGPNPARNEGLRRASTDFVLLMDNDITLEPEYVAKLTTALRAQPECGAASGQIRLLEEPEEVQYNGLELHYIGEIAARAPEAGDTIQVSCVSAGAALFDRRKVAAVGWFDEDFFMGWEDGDLTLRLTLAGYPCLMVSSAAGYHARTPRGMKWVRFQTRNRWWFIFKNYDRRTLLLALPAIMAFQMAAGMFFVMQGQGLEFLRGLADVIRSRADILRKRRDVQALKRVVDRDFLQGRRFDLPLGAAGQAGKIINKLLNAIFYAYWRVISPFLCRHK